VVLCGERAPKPTNLAGSLQRSARETCGPEAKRCEPTILTSGSRPEGRRVFRAAGDLFGFEPCRREACNPA
jgi:hypothetical protein